MATHCTFAELSDVQFHMFCGIEGIAHQGLNRATMQANAAAHDPRYQAARDVAMITVATVRHLAQALALDSGGTRAEMCDRIKIQANLHMAIPPPPAVAVAAPPNNAAVPNPRDFDLISLPNFTDKTQYQLWYQEVRNKMEVRQTWTNCLEDLLSQDAAVRQAAELAKTPIQEQNLILLLTAVKRSLGKGIKDQMQPLIQSNSLQDNVVAIINWIKAQMELLDATLERKALKKLDTLAWRDSKTELSAWVGQLRACAANVGNVLPVGLPRENKIRDLIFKNVSSKDGSVGHIIRSHLMREVTDPGYSVNELVNELTKIFTIQESSGERACLSYAVQIYSEKNSSALLAKVNNKNKVLTKKLK